MALVQSPQFTATAWAQRPGRRCVGGLYPLPVPERTWVSYTQAHAGLWHRLRDGSDRLWRGRVGRLRAAAAFGYEGDGSHTAGQDQDAAGAARTSLPGALGRDGALEA